MPTGKMITNKMGDWTNIHQEKEINGKMK